MESRQPEVNNQPKQNFRVFTQSLDSQKMEYNLPAGTTIEQFKQMISRNSSIPVDKIRLVFRARALADNQRIEEIVTEDDQVFHLIARLNAPENPQPQTTPQPAQPTPPPAPMPFDLGSLITNLSRNINQNPGATGGHVHMHTPLGQTQGNPLGMFSSIFMSSGQGFNPNIQPGQQGTPNAQPGVSNTGGAQVQDLGSLLNNVSSMIGNMMGDPNLAGGVNLQPQQPQQAQQQTPNPAQPTQPQGPVNVEFQNARRSANDVVSVNNQGITISIPTDSDPVHRILDTQSLRITESLINTNSGISIDIPRRQETNNSATMTGNYLRSLHDQLTKFLPQLLKCSDVLQAEQRIRDQEQRGQATRLVRNVGRSFGQFQKAFGNLEFLNTFDLTSQPSGFKLEGAFPTERQSPAPTPVDANDATNPELNYQAQRIRPNSELNEEERIERDRRQVQNLMSTFSRGVPANSTMRDISRISGQESEDTDIISIVFESLNMPDVFTVLAGSFEPLNSNHHKIKTTFQNLLIKNQNNQKKMIADLLGTLTGDLSKGIKKEGEGIIFEGFDVDAVLEEINEAYYPMFADIFLDDYDPEDESKIFSDQYIHLLKMYWGKIAYELSEGMEEGIEAFHRVFKKSNVDYLTKTIGPGFDFASIFDGFVWRHIFEGYNAHRQQEEHKEAERRLMSRIKEAKKEDAEVTPEEQLSDSYKKGKVYE
jgi:hypothetical protein